MGAKFMGGGEDMAVSMGICHNETFSALQEKCVAYVIR